MWKVIEEREFWLEPPDQGQRPLPAILFRLWLLSDEQGPGKGPTRHETYSPSDEPFDRRWEIIYD